MHCAQALLARIRNFLSYQSIRGPAFWIANALIALFVPFPIAAPVLVARLHRPTSPNNKE